MGILEDNIGIEWMNVGTPVVVSPAAFPFARRRITSSLNASTSSEPCLGLAVHKVTRPTIGGSKKPLGPWQMRPPAEALFACTLLLFFLACTLMALIYPL